MEMKEKRSERVHSFDVAYSIEKSLLFLHTYSRS